MKKKILLLFAVLASAINALAYDFQVDGIYYNTVSLQDLTCEVTYCDQNYNTYSNSIIIPSSVTYNGKTLSVTGIGERAFFNCINLTSVEIPNSVSTIRSNAFENCSGLTAVVIPNSVLSIESNAFYDCTSLASVEIGESVITIGGAAFNNCISLASVKIPDSVTDIGPWSFYCCSGMTSLTIGNSVTSIGESAFNGCSSLTSVIIPDSVTELGIEVFSNCTGLTSVVISKSITLIDVALFSNCPNLTSVEIPESVTEIQTQAFSRCKGLTSVVIPNSVTEIIEAFAECTGLASVVIGNSAEYLPSAFNGCIGLKEITSLSFTPPRIDSNTFAEVSKTDAELKVPKTALNAYKSADYWKDFWNIIGIETEDGGGGNNPNTDQCAAPTIDLVGQELVFTCATPGATFHTTITSDDIMDVDGVDTIELTGVYNITTYAYAVGYRNSEKVTATLVWVMPDNGSSNVLSMETKKAVLICVQGGDILVSGTERGETIQIYTIDGLLYCTVSADEYQTVIPCNLNKGEVVIVSYGGKSVKIML